MSSAAMHKYINVHGNSMDTYLTSPGGAAVVVVGGGVLLNQHHQQPHLYGEQVTP